MAVMLGYFLSNLVVITLMVDIVEGNGTALIRDEQKSSAIFTMGEHVRLVPSPGEIHSWTREEDSCVSCGMMCSRLLWCFSFNCGIEPTMDGGKHKCELLSTDKYNSSERLQPSAEFHHFSILVSNFSSPSSEN